MPAAFRDGNNMVNRRREWVVGLVALPIHRKAAYLTRPVVALKNDHRRNALRIGRCIVLDVLPSNPRGKVEVRTSPLLSRSISASCGTINHARKMGLTLESLVAQSANGIDHRRDLVAMLLRAGDATSLRGTRQKHLAAVFTVRNPPNCFATFNRTISLLPIRVKMLPTCFAVEAVRDCCREMFLPFSLYMSREAAPRRTMASRPPTAR